MFIPHGDDRSSMLILGGAALLLVVVLVGLWFGVLDARTPLVDQLVDALR